MKSIDHDLIFHTHLLEKRNHLKKVYLNVLGSYFKSKLELKSNSSEIFPVN